jgi:hypothetical protein
MGDGPEILDRALVLFPDKVFLLHQIKEVKFQLEVETFRFKSRFSGKKDLSACGHPFLEVEGAWDSLLLLEIAWQAIMRDDSEKSGESEIIFQDLIDFRRNRWRCFIDGFPSGKDDRNLNEGRCVDIKIDPCVCSRGENEKSQKKDNKRSFHELLQFAAISQHRFTPGEGLGV